MANPILIKKYGNRRLYDTEDSRYITLEELATKIRAGGDVRVVDAKTSEDLTQVTLTQIIIESRGAARLLPVPLLMQLVRLGDDSLAEFFGQYVHAALELYLQAKRGVRAAAAYNPLAAVPLAATDALARMWMASPFGPPVAAPPPPAPSREHREDVADLRRELEELKQAMRQDRDEPTSQPRRRARRGPARKKRS